MNMMPIIGRPRMDSSMTTEQLVQLITSNNAKLAVALEKNATTTNELSARMLSLEQKFANHKPNGGGERGPSIGMQVAKSPQLKAFLESGARGSCRVTLPRAEITYASGTTGIAAPDHQREIVGLGQQRLFIRDLLAPGSTTSDMVKFVRQTDRNLAAAPVPADGTTAKPESDLQYSLEEAPVRTIAHVMPVHRQTFEDVTGLAQHIDSEMRYGVRLEEEEQVISGDGTGENLSGLIPNATAFDTTQARPGDTEIDILLRAIAQAQLSNLPATGIVLNQTDWFRMQLIKEAGTGAYVLGGPKGTNGNVLWGLPVVATPSLDSGEFLVGAFSLAAQLIDRMLIEVLISSEHADFFIKNMLMIRAENRVALAVKRPQAIIYGDFDEIVSS